MEQINYKKLVAWLRGQEVTRPNATENGTLSVHATGEPFEKLVYRHLKELHPNTVYKQFEYLNDLYRKHPQCITVQDRAALFDSPTALFLLSRSDAATRNWNPDNVFDEKQNDTADIVFHQNRKFSLIDVKTRNTAKKAMPPNIISAYKVAQMCAIMLDNMEFDNISLNYIEVDWCEKGSKLLCENAYYANLFKSTPNTLYINWAAAMQIQFHVADLDQSFNANLEQWTREYLNVFVRSAEHRCKIMHDKYVKPFKKYL